MRIFSGIQPTGRKHLGNYIGAIRGYLEGQEHRRRVEHVARERGGVVGDRDRVQVDDAVDRLAAILPDDVLADRSDVVAEVLAPRRLDAAEDPHRPERMRVARRDLSPPVGRIEGMRTILASILVLLVSAVGAAPAAASGGPVIPSGVNGSAGVADPGGEFNLSLIHI